MDYLFVAALVLNACLFAGNLYSGAFFSRSAGLKLGGAGVATCALAIYAGMAFGWWGVVIPGIFMAAHALLTLAALGGER